MQTRRPVAALLIALAAGFGSGGVVAAEDHGYLTPRQVRTELRAIAAAHPDIVQVSEIGRTYQGRPILVAKISDNVGVDEPEPEVLVQARIHAREHITPVTALALLHRLVDGASIDPQVQAIVSGSEIWIIPDANPDGAAYDLSGRKLRWWRKDRQPNEGSTAIGTDPNRNFGYRWGCCGGSSDNPFAITYRGSAPFSAAEADVMRDFVLSRRVGDVQQLRLAFAIHSYGGQVLWPYGYTRLDTPQDMTRADRRAMVALAQGFAARAGFSAMQESSLYVTSGTFLDWAYGDQRILTLTVEMPPRTQDDGGFYPTPARMAAIAARSLDAFLWWLEQAQDPIGGGRRPAAGERGGPC